MAHEERTQRGPHPEVTEPELVRRIQAGDAEAFDALFRQYCGKVLRQAMHFIGNIEEAEEVVQEVFLAVYEKAHTFRGDAAFATWLYRLTANAALSRLASATTRWPSRIISPSFNPTDITSYDPSSIGQRTSKSAWLMLSYSSSSERLSNSCNHWTRRC